MKTLSPLHFDIRFQFRHGFYYAYVFITILYIVVLRLIPEGLRSMVASIILFSDPCIMGYFFIGATVILERDQNIYQSLFVTPLKPDHFILSKGISFSLITNLTGFTIILLSIGSFNHFVLFIGLTLSSIFFTFLGLSLSLTAKDFNQFLYFSPIILLIFGMPIIQFLGFFNYPIINFIPSWSALMVIDGAVRGSLSNDILLHGIILLVWCVIAYGFARKSLITYLSLKM